MLKDEELIIGNVTNTKIALLYIDDLVEKKKLKNLKNRLDKI